MGGSPAVQREFGVYQHAAISSALSAMSVRPSRRDITVIIMLSFLFAFLLLTLTYRSYGAAAFIAMIGASQDIAFIMVRSSQAALAIFFAGTMSALYKAVSLQAAADASIIAGATKKDASISSNMALTKHQQTLIGLSGLGRKKYELQKGNTDLSAEVEGMNNLRQRPPRVHSSPTQHSTSPSHALMVPLHPPVSKAGRGLGDAGGSSPWGGGKSPVAMSRPNSTVSPTGSMAVPGALYCSQASPYSAPTYLTTPSGTDSSPLELLATPWSRQKSFALKEDIQSEENLNKFLAEVDTKMMESAGRSALQSQGFMTPPPTIRGIAANVTTASPILPPASSASGQLRTLRLSPSQKGVTPPKKGDNELPSPMSVEQVREGLVLLGVHAYVDQWRDALRQWFSEVLLNPLVYKIDSSHLQVMAAASKLGLSINVSPVGGNRIGGGGPKPVSGTGDSLEWLPASSDEDAMLQHLRVALVQARNTLPTSQPSLFGLQTVGPEQVINPLVQDCLDAVTEHQRLRLLMKGEWFKGLLPLSSVRADITVQRIRELAEGTCVKKFDFMGSGGDSKKPNPELPSDPHLLLYLFCALLEHPQWMLHVDTYAHSSMQIGSNPLFLNTLPSSEQYPEKHVAVLSGVPGSIPAGACVLAVGKQIPPVFALYWDKKMQFSLQGRTALWDAILLLCYRIKVAHGGVLRGISLGSPTYGLLSVLESSLCSPLR